MFQAEIIGNLGRDCQFQKINGFEFYSFSVAHSVKSKSSDGQVKVETTWIDCVLTKEQGERVEKYLVKGQKVYCRGSVTVKIYKTKNNTYNAGINMRVSLLELCGSSQDQRQMQQHQTTDDFAVAQNPTAPSMNEHQEKSNEAGFNSDEQLPF